jgi:peroxiredoxin
MERFDLTFPVVRDGSGDTIRDYGVTGFPETFVLDREGRVVDAFAGAINAAEDKERLGSAIERALES